MLSLMQQNITLNTLETKVIAEVLDWGMSTSSSMKHHFSSSGLPDEGQHPNVVLAADCVYFEPAFPLLLQTMHQLLGPNTVCYFCFKKRRKADWRFIKDMKKQFEVMEPRYDDQGKDRREGIYLYAVRRKSNQIQVDLEENA
jgi:protein N-lysine methyltransferase METTL21A